MGDELYLNVKHTFLGVIFLGRYLSITYTVQYIMDLRGCQGNSSTAPQRVTFLTGPSLDNQFNRPGAY
jgi:hypothetical protein